jgi:hypothetical protein
MNPPDYLEAIRELNERGTSHLITMMNAVQRVTLERDRARAELRQLREELRQQTANREP